MRTGTKTARADKGEPRLTNSRGQALKGDGRSYQCRINRHHRCTAMKCTCNCGHGLEKDHK